MNQVNATPDAGMLGDESFWLSLDSKATISEQPFAGAGEQYRLEPQQEQRMVRQSVEDGYFESPALIDREDTGRLREMIAMLHTAGVMPLYITVYDEFWRFLYRIRHVARAILGDGYQFVPDFWAWYLVPGNETIGWKPHRDAQPVKGMARADGRPKMCTLWIPLMDVDPSNSCIYVLPRKHDDEYRRMITKAHDDPTGSVINKSPVTIQNLTRIRALPVREGAFLGWDAALFHWGSGSSSWAREPRVSIGIYVQSEDMPPYAPPYDESGVRSINLDDPAARMPFRTRLAIIANILDTYIYKFNKGTEQDSLLTDEVRKFHQEWKWTG